MPSADLTPPAVDALQHAYDVLFPELERSSEGLWYVAFTPSRDGEHALFSGFQGEQLGLQITIEGEQQRLIHQESIEQPEDCGEMTTVTVVPLRAGVPATVALGPTDASETRVFFEHMPTFGSDAWEETCD